MKKVLIATTALVGLAGAAVAEVAVTGDARMGVRYGSHLDNGEGGTDGAWNVISRARVKFTMTGQTDSGLDFGASLRADQAEGARAGGNNRASGYKGQVWASGTYGKLTVGDIDSAISNAVGHLPYVGVSELDDLNEFWYSTADLDEELEQAGLLYEYSISGVKLFASFHDQYTPGTATKIRDHSYSLGAAYEMNGWDLGIGWERSGFLNDPVLGYVVDPAVGATRLTNGTIALSAAGSFGETKVKGILARTKVNPAAPGDYNIDQVGLGAEYAMANGVGLHGFFRHVKNESVNASGLDNTDGRANILGLGASYDLGGGATVLGGIVHSQYKDGYREANDGRKNNTMADFGLSFKF